MSSASSSSSVTPSSIITGVNNGSLGFSVRATVLYIGLSVGILLVVLFLLAFSLLYCVRPGRRRTQATASIRRHRNAAIEAAKADGEDFKPQLRPIPVVVIQPGSEHVAFAREDGSPMGSAELPDRTNADHGAGKTSAAEDPELGESSQRGGTPSTEEASVDKSRGTRDGASSSSLSVVGGEEECQLEGDGRETTASTQAPSVEEETGTAETTMQYNPLTHYLTEKNALYFVATVDL